ncbi:hypothetical protein HJB53_30190 [Rhizobium lentis]|uniref:hypothetical protein n=1 Tax=Rhizobium lentis TaxID=1138194 RepID=UPI001C83D000|nr:hypothetical protein [Rhizobium lentis]MBX5130762.1 hypothetical protein [Rhizobium lentis]
MRIVQQMLNHLHSDLSFGGSRGDFRNDIWTVTWRLGVKRIEDKARDSVFSIHNVTLAAKYRRQGFFTELLRHLDERPELGGRRFDWIFLEQVNHRLAGHLGRELQYKSDFGMVIDCWRRVTGQLEMKL